MTEPAPAPRSERGTHRRLREEVAALHGHLVRYQLVTWTAGNVSARVPGHDLFVIKASGVDYESLDWRGVVVCDLDGNLVDGEHAPSSDTAAHAHVLPRAPRRRWPGTHAQPVRDGVGGAGRGDPLRAHGDGRRVRGPDPGRPVRDHR